MEFKKKKLLKAAQNLGEALTQYRADKTDLNFLTLVKTFENAVEYSWREFKRLVEDQGLEAPAPKIAVREAARLHLLTEPEIWIACIDARNDSAHDYFGISETDYVHLAEKLVGLIQKSKIF